MAVAQAMPSMSIRAERDVRARDDRRLIERYHCSGDLAAREQLVERFLPLARRLARRYHGGDQPFEDLMQVASLALVKAVDRFEPGRGTSFATYAVPTIVGELRRYFRDCGWALHVPRSVQDRALEVSEAAARLSRELKRSPTPHEVAEALDEDVEVVLEAMEAHSAHHAVSLDTPRDAEDESGGTVADEIGEIDRRYDLIDEVDAIVPGLRALPERDRMVLRLRFEEDMTQSEIAAQIGVSQMHVSRILRRSLHRLAVVAERGV